MRSILFIQERYPGIGGIEKVTTYLGNYFLEKCNYRVTILSVYPECDVERDPILNKNIEIINLYNRKTPTNPSDAQYVNKIIENNKVTHILYQDSYSDNLNLLSNIDRNRVKIILSEHNTPNAQIIDKIVEFKTAPIIDFKTLKRKISFPIIYLKNRLRVKKHHKNAYKLSDKYIVLANPYMEMVSKMVGDNAKLSYINNPITLNQCIESIHSTNKKNEILFICRLSTQKGINFLLKIWEEFSKHHSDWILRIVGDGSERNNMINIINKRKIGNIIFEGKQTDVVSYYKKAKIVLMTSRFEGWPLTLTEGMSFGCIPIAFNSYKAVYDIIDNETNGFIVNAFDIKTYIEKLDNLVSDVSLQNEMAYNAFTKSQNFTMENIGKLWFDLIENMK